MMPYLTSYYGNPSSTYSVGRSTRMGIETSRKQVGRLLGVKPSTIYFTSGGTESNNTAIATSIRDLGCTHIITSPIEHHAVLHTVEYYSSQFRIPYSLVALTDDGRVDYDNLEEQLKGYTIDGKKCLISLMHANNEIGSLLNIDYVGELSKKYNCIFHSDCVQTVGHYPLNLSKINVDFISGAAHKFHGPKGTGILYVNPSLKINPFIYGGGQERGLRAGTENVYGIVGFARALELAMEGYENDSVYIGGLKSYMREKLSETVPGVTFNGPEESLYTILSVCFPKSIVSESLLNYLDLEGICVSGGSACSSGAGSGSHVIRALVGNDDCIPVRFSFSKYNTMPEIERVVDVIKSKYAVEIGTTDSQEASKWK
jgi:cysteine desulfurase